VVIPTCPLAMAEAERFLPSFIDKVEEVMAKHGLSDEHIDARDGLPERLWPRDAGEVWWGKRLVAITCIWAVTASVRASRACSKRTLPSRNHCLAR
jgi:hypothetical protein